MAFRTLIALFALTTALGAAAPAALQGPQRIGALVGLLTAAAGAAVTLALLRRAAHGRVKQAFAALVTGMLARMILVAGGLVASLKAGGEPVAFCATFFGIYLAQQVIEIAVVHRTGRRAEGKA